jgi:hypothetical protein
MPEEPAKLDETLMPRKAWLSGERRAVVLWSLGIGAAAILGLCCWRVGLVWQTRGVVKRCDYMGAVMGYDEYVTYAQEELRALGTPEQAVGRLTSYLRLPDRLAPYKSGAVDLLGCCGRPGIQELLRLASDPGRPDEFLEAFRALGPSRSEEAKAFLVDQVKNGRHRSEAAAALRFFKGDAEATKALVEMVSSDADSGNRATAARSLTNMPGDAAAAALLEALKDSAASVRKEAAYGLGRRETPQALAAVGAIVRNDRDETVRKAAVSGLGLLKKASPEAMAILQAALDDANWEVKVAAKEAIGQLSAQGQTTAAPSNGQE